MTSGARSASSHRTIIRPKLERIDNSQAKTADDTKSTTASPSSSRVKRPASNDNDPGKTIDPTKRGNKGDDVLEAINTMIKRRFNNNVNTNINTNDFGDEQSQENQ